MVPVGRDYYEEALAKTGEREMDFTGKPLKGMVYISQDILTEDEDLLEWIQNGMDFVGMLPAKK